MKFRVGRKVKWAFVALIAVTAGLMATHRATYSEGVNIDKSRDRIEILELLNRHQIYIDLGEPERYASVLFALAPRDAAHVAVLVRDFCGRSAAVARRPLCSPILHGNHKWRAPNVRQERVGGAMKCNYRNRARWVAALASEVAALNSA